MCYFVNGVLGVDNMCNIKQFLSEIGSSAGRSASVMQKWHGEDNFSNDCTDDGGIIFSKLTGIDASMFPNPFLITNFDINLIVSSLINLYEQYGLNPLFHPNVNAINKYLQLQDGCNSVVYPAFDDTADVEFCDYKKQSCPYSYTCTLGCESSIFARLIGQSTIRFIATL